MIYSLKSWATLYTGIYDPDKKSSWAVQGYLWPDQYDQRIHHHVGNTYWRVNILVLIIGGIMDLSCFLLFESISQSLLYFWWCALYIMCICTTSLFSVISKSISLGVLDLLELVPRNLLRFLYDALTNIPIEALCV